LALGIDLGTGFPNLGVDRATKRSLIFKMRFLIFGTNFVRRRDPLVGALRPGAG
jgi:hypothetical protein